LGGRTRESVIVLICQLIINEHRMRPIFLLETLLHAIDLVLGHLETRPAVPLERCGLRETAETGDEAAGGHGEAVAAIFGAFDGDGESVGEEEEATRDGLTSLVDDGGHIVDKPLGLRGVVLFSTREKVDV
jgi:hypothetical protein